MRHPRNTLQDMASVIAIEGLHRGEQLAHRGYIDRLDICALAYITAEWIGPTNIPAEFYTDELAGIRLIECSAGAMTAIRTLSEALDTPVTEDKVPRGLYVPNWIEHVSNWARTTPIGETQPPSDNEVIGRILRAANTLTTQSAAHTPAA